MQELRVLSFNIHKGVHFLTRRKVLERLKDFIVNSRATLVCLQEICGEPQVEKTQTQLATQLEFLADTVWTHYAYGKNAIYESGHHGNAVLSQLPIISHVNIDVSNNRLERRGLLHATIQPDGWPLPLHIICIHLDLTPWGRTLQLEKIMTRIHAEVPPLAPLIIAGDFNEWSDRASRPLHQEFGLVEAHQSTHGRLAQTFPSWLPLLPLDRIYVRGLTVTGCEVQTNSLSDHCALLADIRLEFDR